MSPGVVAAIHLAGVRGEPCGAVRHKVHHVHPHGACSMYRKEKRCIEVFSG